jgi:hypothetical protein
MAKLINFYSSTIIQDIAHHCQVEMSFAMAYFYFDFNDVNKRQSRNLVRSLLTQFSVQCPKCPEVLTTVYSQHLKGVQEPTTQGLLVALKQIIQSFQHAYIVIDALDECTDREDLLTLVQEMVKWKLDRLHILVTSRRERYIADCLEPLIPESARINLHTKLIGGDIRAYCRQRLRRDSKFHKWSPAVLANIESTLVDGANGM